MAHCGEKDYVSQLFLKHILIIKSEQREEKTFILAHSSAIILWKSRVPAVNTFL